MRRFSSFIKKVDVNMTFASNEASFNRFINQVYNKTAIGVGGTLATASVLSIMSPSIGCLVGGIAGSFGSIYMMNKYSPKYVMTKVQSDVFGEKEENVIVAEHPPQRQMAFWGLSFSMGCMMQPMIAITSVVDPMIVPVATCVSLAIFGGSSYIARKLNNTEVLKWKAPLFLGLGSLIVTQLVGLVGNFFFPGNSLSQVLHSVDLYGGIGLMSLLSVYDYHAAKNMFNKGTPDDRNYC